jgi:hypothetical protein
VQLRLESKLTSEEYVTRGAWRDANLASCPRHPRGGCGFRSCGTYGRKQPAGLRVRRWYCPTSHETFSLLPDFAASRVSSTLAEIEGVVAVVQHARAQGVEPAERVARELRPDIERDGALRWVRRRRRWVEAALAVLIGLAPEVLAGCEPTLSSVRTALGCECALVRMREMAAAQLAHLPAPVGLAPRVKRAHRRAARRAHEMGPAPPALDE